MIPSELVCFNCVRAYAGLLAFLCVRQCVCCSLMMNCGVSLFDSVCYRALGKQWVDLST